MFLVEQRCDSRPNLLVRHPLVQKVSFTGGPRTARKILAACAEGIKPPFWSWAASPPTSCSLTPTSTPPPAGTFLVC